MLSVCNKNDSKCMMMLIRNPWMWKVKCYMANKLIYIQSKHSSERIQLKWKLIERQRFQVRTWMRQSAMRRGWYGEPCTSRCSSSLRAAGMHLGPVQSLSSSGMLHISDSTNTDSQCWPSHLLLQGRCPALGQVLQVVLEAEPLVHWMAARLKAEVQLQSKY